MVFASNAHDLLRVIYNYASCKAGILPAVISASRSGVFTGVIYLIRPSVHLSVCCSPAAVMLHRLFELEIRTRPTKKNGECRCGRAWENVDGKTCGSCFVASWLELDAVTLPCGCGGLSVVFSIRHELLFCTHVFPSKAYGLLNTRRLVTFTSALL